MAYGTNTSGNAGQVAIDRFAEMMIARMEQMKASDWKKGWIGGALSLIHISEPTRRS